MADSNSKSGFNYGLIGNGRSAAVISCEGSIDWLCLPNFDSPSAFGRLLDPEGGHFAIRPEITGKVEQRYLRNTNCLETVFSSDQGSFRVVDFMPHHDEELPRGMIDCLPLIRLVERLSGSPRVIVDFQPKLDYGRAKTRFRAYDGLSLVATGGGHRIYLHSSVEAEQLLSGGPFELPELACFTVACGKALPVSLRSPQRAQAQLESSVRFWREWIKQCHLPHYYQDCIIRSALTLKLLIYEPTGGIVAAATMGLPEEIGGERNWDYRYCWLRDSLFIISSLFELSLFHEKERYVEYLKRICIRDGDHVPPLFTIEGGKVPEEKKLEHWRGFKGSQPVRLGNGATDHFQDDVYGEIVLAIYQYFMDRRFVDVEVEPLWEIVSHLVDRAIEHFKTEDAGPWEFNNLPGHYTFSKLMCWVAADRGAAIARKLGKDEPAERWVRHADQMREEILAKAWNEEAGAFTQSYGSTFLDATTLLMPIVGFISARDPRMRATVEQTEKQLMREGFVFRYTREDDFGEPQNAFLVCTFWLVDTLVLMGEVKRARETFERLMSKGNHLNLFSEHIEPSTGRLTGNFPQGYTHVAIIYTGMMISAYSAQETGMGYLHEI
jgi:alpha,alpha-trehalase